MGPAGGSVRGGGCCGDVRIRRWDVWSAGSACHAGSLQELKGGRPGAGRVAGTAARRDGQAQAPPLPWAQAQREASAGGTGSASERGGGLAGRVGLRLLPCRQPCKVAAPAHQSPSTPARVMGSEREKAACTGQRKGSRIVVVLLGASVRNLNLTAFNDHDVPSGL